MELFSPGHLIPLLIVVAILFFGWKQLPDMARSVGRSLRIFKTEMKGMGEDDAARDARADTPLGADKPPAVVTAPTAATPLAGPPPAAAPLAGPPPAAAPVPPPGTP
ncbi:MAG: twin-arginine translocase TatA/TatE family subunit, partial [Actinomycetota bacterium]